MTSFISIFVNVILPVFGVVLCGYLVGGRLQLHSPSLSRAAYYVFVPAFVFQAVKGSNIPFTAALQMIIFFTLAQVLITVVTVVIARLLGRNKEMIVAYIIVSGFINVGNYGLAVIRFRLGEEAIPSATIYYITVAVVQFIIGVGAISWARGGMRNIFGGLIRTPAIMAVVPAILLNLSGFELPLMPSRMIGLLASAMIPVMLFTLGLQLFEQKRFQFTTDLFIASAIRLLVAPALAFVIGRQFSLSPTELASGVLQMAMPTAVIATMLAAEKNVAPAFVNTGVMLTTLASLVTLPLVMVLL